MTTPSFVRLAGEAATAEIRRATYAGQDVIVVPIVALVGGVTVTGLSSDGPEYIPPDVLAAAPGGWSGRPVLAAHPSGTANTPEQWSTSVFGQVFGSTFEDNRLRCELWLSPRLAERAGEDAMRVIELAESGEMFEVSVGAWVWLEEEEGVSPSGDEYSYRWQAAVPDHISAGLFQHGGKGACDKSMGCGGPRVFSAKQAKAIKDAKETADMSQSLVARLAVRLGKDGLEKLAEGMSNNELHQKLNRALRAVVPAFWGVEDIFMDSSTAIYVAMPGDSLEFWECAFTVGENGEVTLGRRKQVEPVTEWKKVAKANDKANDSTVQALETIQENLGKALDKCKCHEAANGDSAGGSDQPPTQGNQGVTTMSDKAPDKAADKGAAAEPTAKAVELAGRLIANSATPFTDTEPAVLAALGETKLQALVDKYTEPADPASGRVEADPNAVTISKDELTRLRSMAAREEARDKQHRAQLVAALLATGRKGFDEKQLNAKSTDELVQLAEFAGINEEDPVLVGPGTFALSQQGISDFNDYAPPDPWKSPAALVKQLGYRSAT